ncbi:MAG: bifunctional phosphopantothenoylcysteine decarboxylase/phosphopantothenate--cysteine ligase CoaBC [Alphaproteobacteria bacterium]|nr:bifunctional phosphopantothenoylcysteine decarboxylase/phosphopantothenate--cysteine ligase CoaBC [Alphaproteobacteria bacterium]
MRSLLLIISGSVAAYKSLELIRLCKEQGIEVTAILTKAGAQFITPLAVSSLTGTKTYDALFSLTDEVEMGHIELSRSADAVLVAPASADIIAKMAAGIADDLATTALLATNKPVFIAPAMNHMMWKHAATKRNIAQLSKDGVTVIEPTEGSMACGEHGIGRLAEPADILRALTTARGQAKGALAGKKVLVTSGPTHEPIDPVRYIANRSSGKQGHALATAFAEAGADVTLISGPTRLADPSNVRMVHVTTAKEMLEATLEALPSDIAVCAAAVSDWHVAHIASQKIKKTAPHSTPRLTLVENPDILAQIAQHKTKRPTLVIGFAAETHAVLKYARDKLKKKRSDWMVANDVSSGQAFERDDNSVTLITQSGEERLERMSKLAIARAIVARAASEITPKKRGKS